MSKQEKKLTFYTFRNILLIAIGIVIILMNFFLPFSGFGEMDHWSKFGESFGFSSGILSFISIILILLSLHEQSKTSSEIAENQERKIVNYQMATSITAFQAIIVSLHKNIAEHEDAINKYKESLGVIEKDEKAGKIEKIFLAQDYIKNCEAEICRFLNQLDGLDNDDFNNLEEKSPNKNLEQKWKKFDILKFAYQLSQEEQVPVKAILSYNNQEKIENLVNTTETEAITSEDLKHALRDTIYNLFSMRLSGQQKNMSDPMDLTSDRLYLDLRYWRNCESWIKKCSFSEILSNGKIKEIAINKCVTKRVTDEIPNQDVLAEVNKIVSAHSPPPSATHQAVCVAPVDNDSVIYERLKNWRNEQMKKEEKRHYYDVLTNPELMDIVQRVQSRPTTDKFETLPISYRFRAKRYAEDIVKILETDEITT